MALEITNAVASVSQAVLTDTFDLTITVYNSGSSKVSDCSFRFTIDGTTASKADDLFDIGAKKTVTRTLTYNGLCPTAWTTAMASQRSASMNVAVRNGDTFSESFTVESFIFIDRLYSPTVEKFEIERTADEAETVKTTIKLAHADGLTDTQIARLGCELQCWNKSTGDVTTITLNRTVAELLTGITDDTTAITDTFGRDTDFLFTLSFGDLCETVEATSLVVHAFANLSLSGCETGGACFGGFCKSSEGSPMLESHFPIYPYQHIIGQGGADCGVVSEWAVSSGDHDLKEITFSNPFPEGTTPVVMITMTSTTDSYYMALTNIYLQEVTNTGFKVRVVNCTGKSGTWSIGFMWLAIGQTTEVT